MLTDLVFIHYGSNKFSKRKFKEIKNRRHFNKPSGGLWSSPIKSNHSWRKFCLDEQFNMSSLNSYFLFKIKKSSNIVTINSSADLKKLRKYFIIDKNFCYIFLDFYKMAKDGFDGIYLTEFGEYNTRYNYYNEVNFYGWDVESLLIFNPDIIQIVGDRRVKISKKNYRNNYIFINTNKEIDVVNNKEILYWNRNYSKSKSSFSTTIFDCGKNYKSSKSFNRAIRKLLNKTKDDPDRSIILK